MHKHIQCNHNNSSLTTEIDERERKKNHIWQAVNSPLSHFIMSKLKATPRMSNVSPMKSKTIDINESCTSNKLAELFGVYETEAKQMKMIWMNITWTQRMKTDWDRQSAEFDGYTWDSISQNTFPEQRIYVCVCVWACGLQAEGLVARQWSCCKFDNIITEWMDWGAG